MSERGRPTIYTPELAEEICDQLAAGESLNAICTPDHMPDESTVRKWAVTDYKGFYPKYAQAREIQADRFADDLAEIADSATKDNWQVAKLRVETRKWITERILPKRFGKKTEVRNFNVDLAGLSDEQLARIASGEDPVQVVASS